MVNTASFDNLQPDVYWSGTEYAPDTDGAWDFIFFHGYQNADMKYNSYYALAVRPGDSASVPEPGTMMLLGTGIAGLVASRKRFLRRHG